MKQTKKMRALLERMERIKRMERGTLCRMAGRPYYNHQTWQNGRNVVRYVSKSEVAELKKDLDGYRRFAKLAELYADEVIHATRKEKARRKRRAKAKSRNSRI
jgi:hypothetical protein